MKSRAYLLGVTWVLGLAIGHGVLAQNIPIYALPKAPVVDGNDADWDTGPFTTVALKKTNPDGQVQVKSVSLKGGTHGNSVFLYLEWEDGTQDNIHKPWVWNDASQKYKKGSQREDRLAVQFAMEGSYTTDWRSGNEFSADTWHWKASRSDPLGLAHDKSLVISRSKLLRAYKLDLPDGGHVYLSRPSDSGDKLYKTKRYRRFDRQIMPKYVLTESPEGSVADVSAHGVWSEGKWRLELSRELRTGHGDDVVFPLKPGKIPGGIAVFDRSENNDHVVSDTVMFEFLYHPWRPE